MSDSLQKTKCAAPSLLTRPEAANALGISLRKTDSLIATGDLPVVRFGASVRIRVSAIESLIESRETRHNPARTSGRYQTPAAK